MPKESSISTYRRAEELYVQAVRENRSVYWIWKGLTNEGKEVQLKNIQRWAKRWDELGKVI